MKSIFTPSFATKLSIYVLSFTLLVFIGVTALFYYYSRSQITDNAVEHAHGLLRHTATQISGEMHTIETVIKQSVWIVEQNLNKPDVLRNVVSTITNSNDLVIGSGIAFVADYYKDKGTYFMPYASNHSGQESQTTYQVLGSADYDYFGMDWFLIPRLLKKSYWSEPYYDTGGGNTIMSTYSLPLCNKQGEVYAIFTVDVSLSKFTDIVNELKPYSSSYTFLLSRNGSYLTHPDRAKIMNETIFSNAFDSENTVQEELGRKMLAGVTGTTKYGRTEQDSYAFFTTIPNSGWSICTICPSQVILHGLSDTLQRTFLIFLIGILVLFPVVHLIIRRLVRPLRKFSESARAIATGRFDVTLPAVTSKDEIQDLHDSLVYMQNSLSGYVSELRITTALKERIESELTIAREIQMGMIPKTFPPYPGRNDIDIYAILHPAKEVGGDLYDFFIDNNRLYFVIGDVSGKGVPASLFMAIARSMFRTLSQQSSSPAEIMTQMNHTTTQNNEANMFITLIIGILDLETGKLCLCNAGHNPPILIKSDGTATFLKTKIQLFVGILEEMEYQDEEITLDKESRLLLYTDGVTEAENGNKDLYGEDHFLSTVKSVSTQDARAVVETIISSVATHVQEAEASDDLTILLIHYQPKLMTS